jgi:histone acetyltransferase SAS3
VEEGGAVKVQVLITNGRRSTRSSASSTDSPHMGRDAKGKGRVLPVEEELEEELDADGDYEDVDGDMDIDAEGEDDDDILMVDA